MLAGGAGVYSFYMLVWLYADLGLRSKPPETAAVVTPDDADGDEPAGDEEKRAE